MTQEIIENQSNDIQRNTKKPSTAQYYIKQATAENTRQAYRQDIRHFEQWGGLLPASSQTIIRYLLDHAQSLSTRTLQRRLVAIKQFHLYQGFPDPTGHPSVQKTMTGIKKTHGKPRAKAPALRLEQLEQCITSWPKSNSLNDARDQALLCVGFFGAFRGRELLRIDISHLEWREQGVHISIPKSKTDQTGDGQSCALPSLNNAVCPVAALKRWLETSEIKTGLVFPGISRWGQVRSTPMTLRTLNLMIKSQAERCQFEQAERFSSHSLRRGLATSASAAGASFKSIMRQGRWRHEGTVLEYIEEGQQFQDNAIHSFYDTS